MAWEKVKQKIISLESFVLEVLFPCFCFGCRKEGSYLCEDCQAVLEISQFRYCLCQKPQRLVIGGKCRLCDYKKLNGLYSAVPYQNQIVQALIKKMKYEPFAKDITKTLASLIISHFQLVDNPPALFGFSLMPVPLEKRRLKWRGFNQAEEIAKELSSAWQIPLLQEVLAKTKTTLAQAELSDFERQENIKNAFVCQKPELVQNKKLLLVDDVYTSGATMEEAARILKQAGAKEVWGVTVARG